MLPRKHDAEYGNDAALGSTPIVTFGEASPGSPRSRSSSSGSPGPPHPPSPPPGLVFPSCGGWARGRGARRVGARSAERASRCDSGEIRSYLGCGGERRGASGEGESKRMGGGGRLRGPSPSSRWKLAPVQGSHRRFVCDLPPASLLEMTRTPSGLMRLAGAQAGGASRVLST
uniref:Uncharacterized protein n=1 Tax=Rangifer tarandus platyrhynchus TaxID=3082113 RepID=A0ACB0EPB9_RANTA|nr:unnamed protein product [Rangifer tarandus platyrhynchus]